MRKKITEKPHTRTTKKPATIEDNFYLTGCVILAAGAAAAAVSFLRPDITRLLNLPPCIFHLLTGYYCPGCGGTRAFRALLHGHILDSLCYHPVVLYGLSVYLYFMLTQTIQRLSRQKFSIGMRYRSIYAWICVAVILGNFVLKNLLHHFCGYVML